MGKTSHLNSHNRICLCQHHFSIQVHRVDYAFGAHKYSTTGIFEGEPRRCDGFTFRKTILIGKTDMRSDEIRCMMEELAGEYQE
ncbi:hypothetical protein K1719_000208 [Acacia pycnantha]|nr:hypothetical protein K1719_000208 [Acacia pycnantha]